MLTPKDIEEYPLEKAAFGGYKCEAVDAFLDRIAADYKQLTEENETLTKKITVLVEKIALTAAPTRPRPLPRTRWTSLLARCASRWMPMPALI